MGKVIAYTGKGGTGKSVCVANIAYALSKLDKKVLIIDCDFGMRSQDIIFDVQSSAVYNLNDILSDSCKEEDAIIKINDYLEIICASNNVYLDEINFDAFIALINKYKDNYDYIFIDCPATVCKGVDKILSICNCVIVLSDCTLVSARAGDLIATLAEKHNVLEKYLIINKINIDSGRKNGIINSEEVLDIVALVPVGAVPYDKELGGLVFNNKKSLAKKAFANIALRLNGEKVPVLYAKKLRK